MEILQIVGIGIVATILIVVLRQYRPEMALQLSLAVGAIIFLLILGKIAVILGLLEQLASRANINMAYLETILKIIGIAYIAEFGAQICRDAGEGAIATKVELGGKVLIMVMAFPIMMVVLESIIELIP